MYSERSLIIKLNSDHVFQRLTHRFKPIFDFFYGGNASLHNSKVFKLRDHNHYNLDTMSGFQKPKEAVEFFKRRNPSSNDEDGLSRQSRLEEYCGHDTGKCHELQTLINKYAKLNQRAKIELMHKLNELCDEVGRRSIHSSTSQADYDSDVVLVRHDPTHKTILAGHVEEECNFYGGPAHLEAMHERLRQRQPHEWKYGPEDPTGETFPGPGSWLDHQLLHSTLYGGVSERPRNLRSSGRTSSSSSALDSLSFRSAPP